MSPRRTAPLATATHNYSTLCNKCGGTGQILDPKNPAKTIPCPECQGVGRGGNSSRWSRRKKHAEPATARTRTLDKDTLRSMRNIRNNLSAITSDLSNLTRYDISDQNQRSDVHKKLATLTRLHGQWSSRIESGKQTTGMERLAAQTRKTAEDILATLPTDGSTQRLNRLRDKLSDLATASPPTTSNS